MKEFYVKRYDVNRNRIVDFNIFDNIKFTRELEKINKNKLSKEEYLQEIDSLLMYCFWCKCEYEVSIGRPFEQNVSKLIKMDVYQQCLPNINIIAQICKN